MRAAQELHEGKTVGQAELDAVLLEAEEIINGFLIRFVSRRPHQKIHILPRSSTIVFSLRSLLCRGRRRRWFLNRGLPGLYNGVFAGLLSRPCSPPLRRA